MAQKKNRKKRKMLPYAVIVAASSGDVKAINTVLDYYKGYIIALSARQMRDINGKPCLVVDEELRRTLETKLITKILTFRAA
jgi:hypothetical protein